MTVRMPVIIPAVNVGSRVAKRNSSHMDAWPGSFPSLLFGVVTVSWDMIGSFLAYRLFGEKLF